MSNEFICIDRAIQEAECEVRESLIELAEIREEQARRVVCTGRLEPFHVAWSYALSNVLLAHARLLRVAEQELANGQCDLDKAVKAISYRGMDRFAW